MKSRLVAAPLLGFTLLSILACGWFGEDLQEDALDVTYTADFDFDLPLDANALCPTGLDCSEAAVPAPVDRELMPIEINVDLDIVEQTMKPELADYAGKFKRIQISKITYEATNNDLTFDVPPLNLYIGPVGAEKPTDEGVIALATTPVVVKMTNGQLEATINEANRDQISALIQSLQVSAVAQATPVVKKGEQFPPSGKVDLKVTIFVTLVANPADAIRKSTSN